MTVKGESLRELVQLQRKMNQLFEEMLQPDQPRTALPEYTWVPAADVFEDGEHFYVELELPGIQIDDVESSAGNASCAGERKLDGADPRACSAERYLGPFGRAFPEALTRQGRGAHQDGCLRENPQAEPHHPGWRAGRGHHGQRDLYEARTAARRPAAEIKKA
jgi:HSP20 family molecular chaperone IbpA